MAFLRTPLRRAAGYALPPDPEDGHARTRRGRIARVAAVAIAAAILPALFFHRCGGPDAELEPPPPPAQTVIATAAPPRYVEFGFPTAQARLVETNSSGVFMPTASGRTESGLYGSVRTAAFGRSILPSFHEGIDIAPLQRDRRRRALDDVVTAADGTVAHVNRIAGNSDYGHYVAMVHSDPAGPVYTLYAHLDELAPNLKAGQVLPRGTRLGRMGRTPTAVIPVERSHLHFEVGVLLNPEFRGWFRARKLKPDHGNYSGLNLFGFNPIAPYVAQASGTPFSLGAHLAAQTPAFELAIQVKRRPNYFALYPSLWRGESYAGGPIVVAVSDGGVPLAGRNADAGEVERIGRARTVVLKADTDVLGRNGRRLVVPRNGAWVLGQAGDAWLDILTYP